MCAGLVPGALTWSAVQSDVEKFASVVSWDRPGFGWCAHSFTRSLTVIRSSPAASPTADLIVDQLRSTLKAGGVPGPYVLVGHSIAGIEIALFAAKYAPHETRIRDERPNVAPIRL